MSLLDKVRFVVTVFHKLIKVNYSWPRKIIAESSLHHTRLWRVGGMIKRGDLLGLLLVGVFCFSAQLCADSKGRAELIDFDIPRQQADTALTLFAEQAKLTLVFPFDEVRGVTANELVGRRTVEDAVNLLLKDTRLTPLFSQDAVLTIRIDNSRGNFMQSKKNLLAVAVSALLSASGVHAQDDEPKGKVMEEVLVSAQRRQEALEDVPIAINSLSNEAMQQAGITRMEDLSRLAPAVQIARTGIYVQPAIRGVTTTQTSAAENNVAIYVDNFYQPATMTLNMDMLNVSSVQVLKGPQGTLFGRNATGGAILVETKNPSLQEIEGVVNLGYGSFDDKRGQFYFSAPVTDNVAFNIAGSRRTSDGYLENTTGFDSAPLESDAVLAKLLVEPTDELRLIAAYNYSRIEDGRSLAVTMGPTATPLAQVSIPSGQITNERNKTSLNHPVQIEGEQNAASLTASYDFSFATLSSYTYHQEIDTFTYYEVDGSTGMLYDEYLSQDYKTFSQELNLTSTGEGPLQYVFGLFYFDAEVNFYDNAFFFRGLTNGYAPRNSSDTDTDAQAAYADVTWEVIDGLFLTGGLRYSREEKTSVFTSPANIRVIDQTQTFYSTTPRLVVRYELSPSTNVYASYSEGFKSGQVNSIPPYDPIEPEEIEAYEIGFKTQQESYSFSASAYSYDYTDLQLATIVRDAAGAQTSITTNAASAEISGAEADVTWNATDALQLSANVAYTHARYDSFPAAPVLVPGALGLNSDRCNGVLCTQDLSGKQMVRAPEWSGNVSATYTLALDAHTVILSGNVAITDSYLPSKSDIGLNGRGYRYEQSGYALYSARVDWVLPGDQIKLSLYGTNLFDKSYDLIRTGSAFGDYHVEGQPRAYGVSAEYTF